MQRHVGTINVSSNSREAAKECSPRRKPWEKQDTEKPHRGERPVLTHTLKPASDVVIDTLLYFFSSAFSAASAVEAFSGLNSGNRITSLIVCESVSSMQTRSMPMPTPPAGGMP